MAAVSLIMLRLTALALACAALSLIANALLMPAYRSYAVARPNARSSHKKPTPQGGGVGVLAAMLVVLATLATTSWGESLRTSGFAGLAVAALILAITGAFDDIVNLAVGPRLAAQFAAAALGLVAALPVASGWLPGGWLIVACPLLLIGLVWFVNLTNFMDGIDGITVAGFVPLAVAIAVAAASGAIAPADGLVAAALLGGLLGFMPYNRHVARLFLGDVGSLSIGLIAGVLLLRLALRGYPVAAVTLPLYYLADATLTLLRRLLRGENVTQAHRTHFYQRATDLGWSVPAITRQIWLSNTGLALLGLLSIWRARTFLDDVLVLATAVVLVARLLRKLSKAAAA